jgi:hypothetical protein
MCKECCCGPSHHRQGHGHHRRFLTKAERVEKLKAIEENISELES